MSNKMKLSKPILTMLLGCIALAGCKSQYEILLAGNDVDAKYEAAFKYFNQGKFQKSAQLFESLASVTGGTERDDTVQYYWGLSNYRYRDYYTAETNFSSFLMNYPMSPFSTDAGYFRIDCLYRQTLRYELDQKPTYSAISAISEYLSSNPDSPYKLICSNMLDELNERLDRKAYENARLYYKMEDYKAASTALRNVLRDDADNVYREDVLYYLAMSTYKYADLSIDAKKKERFMVFVDDYLNFIGEYPESSYRRELNGLYRKAQNYLGKNPSLILAEDDEDGDEA